MFLYRYLLYQRSTKVYDIDFQVPVTEDNIDELIDTFQNIDKLTLLLRSRAYIEHQDQITWYYVLTDKTFKLNPTPYMIVTHKDTESQNIQVLPRYFKNTRQHKITPNLWDLDNFELYNSKLDIPKYSRKLLYRNVLSSPQSLDQLSVPIQSLKVHNPLTHSNTNHDFFLNKIHEQNDLYSA